MANWKGLNKRQRIEEAARRTAARRANKLAKGKQGELGLTGSLSPQVVPIDPPIDPSIAAERDAAYRAGLDAGQAVYKDRMKYFFNALFHLLEA